MFLADAKSCKREQSNRPKLHFIHVDHLNRQIRMTDGSDSVVWDTVYNPLGDASAIPGPGSKPNPSRLGTGRYRNIEDCARGFVSQWCGGNAVEQEWTTLMSHSQESQIDEIILSICKGDWLKTALIIAKTSRQCENNGIPTTDDAIAARIVSLCNVGSLHARGNLSKWRSSEIRLPNEGGAR
jgi:hypothetical protein